MVDSSSKSTPQPLGLTVYDMPTPEQSLPDTQGRTRRGRLMLLFVVLICAAPVIASYFTYYVIRPQGTKVYGDLIDPVKPMPMVSSTALSGEAVTLASLKEQWLLVSVSDSKCDAECEKRLFAQRQLHKLLNKDSARMERVWFLTDEGAPKPELVTALQGARILRLPKDTLAAWLQPAANQSLEEHLYLVDPMGQWMMRFPPELSDKSVVSIKRDLERLMRASSSWDQPDRPLPQGNPK